MLFPVVDMSFFTIDWSLLATKRKLNVFGDAFFGVGMLIWLERDARTSEEDQISFFSVGIPSKQFLNSNWPLQEYLFESVALTVMYSTHYFL